MPVGAPKFDKPLLREDMKLVPNEKGQKMKQQARQEAKIK